MRILTTILFILLFGVTNTYSQTGDFSVGLFAGPTFYHIKSTSSVKYSQDFNYAAGLYVKRNIKIKSFYLSIGSGYFVDTKKTKERYSDTISWYPKTIHTKFVYGNIPITLEFIGNINDKFFPFISTGIIFGKIIYEEQYGELNDGTEVSGFPSKSSNLKNPFDVNFGLGINMKLIKQFLIRCETSYSLQLNEGTSYNQDNLGKLSFNIRLGLQYDIVFKKSKEPKP